MPIPARHGLAGIVIGHTVCLAIDGVSTVNMKHWESYYRGGLLATCPTASDGGYDLELASVWEAFFEPLPDRAEILDIATGNGAIVLLARRLADRLGRDWTIHGSDLAQIDPVAHVPDGYRRFANCHFHPGVNSEQLPFADRSFDALSGQYAFEYSDSVRTLAEVARVLKPNGRVQFIVHHRDSLLACNARDSLAEAELVLAETRIYRRLRRLLSVPEHAPRLDDPATVELRQSIASLRQAQEHKRGEWGGQILAVTLDAVRQLLAMRTRSSPAEVEREIDRVEEELRLAVRRLQDLLGHALDQTAIEVLLDQAAQAGLRCCHSGAQYHDRDHLVGWRLQFVMD